MRSAAFQLILSALLALLLAASAQATPTTVNVRIEGKSETLFEGPVATEGHNIEASSEAVSHPCDGTNEKKHPVPGATPTAAAADAMSIVGETFNGVWEKEDFKITRWGPDSANVAEGEFWGVLVDQTLTSVGGCQVELAPGDQVLWMYNAFAGEPFLTLYSGSEPSGASVASASVEAGEPLTVSVGEYTSSEGSHHVVKPFTAGAEVSPVLTGEHDFQKLETASVESVTSDSSGNAQITFKTPGWHRLKATASQAFRSNRLDVCVLPCGPAPADDGVRSIAAGSEPPPEAPPVEVKPVEEKTSTGTTPKTEAHTTPPPVTGVSASTSAAPAQLHLGKLLLAPLDDRAAALSYHGHWRRISEGGAWLHTLSVGGPWASVSVHLARGRPVFIVRDVHHRARVAVQLGRRHEELTIAPSASGASRPLLLPRRSAAGTVQLRIISGTVGVDGVALTA
jgi:hypothetical protein